MGGCSYVISGTGGHFPSGATGTAVCGGGLTIPHPITHPTVPPVGPPTQPTGASPPTGATPTTGVTPIPTPPTGKIPETIVRPPTPQVPTGCINGWETISQYTALQTQGGQNFEDLIFYLESNYVTNFLLQSNTTNGSIAFTDSSSKNHTVTLNTDPGGAGTGPKHIDTDPLFSTSTSLYFDGTNGHLSVPNEESFQFGKEDFTIDFWLRHTTLGSANPVYFGRWKSSNTSSFICYYQYSESRIEFAFKDADTGDNAFLYTSTSPSINTWYHLAITREGNKLRLFLDGTEQHSVNVYFQT